MVEVRLRDICEFRNGKAHENFVDEKGKYTLVTSKFISSDTTEFRKTNSQLTPLYKGELCMVMSDVPNGRALAKCFLVDENDKYTLNQRIGAFTVDERFDKKYFYYLMNRNRYFLSFNDGNGQTNLRKDDILNFCFKYIEISRQKEIVQKLDQVKGIIEKRKNQLILMDELIKSRFVELFGDCKNTVRLGDCCEVHARIGWQALKKDEHMKAGEYMLITGTDFKGGEINYSTCVYVARERYEMDKHIVLKNDDVLITKDGTIGKVAIVHNLPKPATLNAGVFVVRPDERFNKEYIANVFKGPFFSDYVEASKTGATIKHLNQKHLVEFMIPVPTLAEQEVFARFTKQIDKSKLEIQKSIDELKKLFDSLMQEYFG